MTLLFIDDDPEDVELFCEAIKTIRSDCTCVVAYDGKEGLEILKRVNPDYIFLDINMPKMSGKETLQIIRSIEKLKTVPVCILSTTIGEKEKDTLGRLGATNCIRKAYTFAELCSSLEHLLSKNQIVNNARRQLPKNT